MSRSCTLLRLQHNILKHANTHGAVGHTPLLNLDKMRVDWVRYQTSDGTVLNASVGHVQSFPNREGRRHQPHNDRMHDAYTSTVATILSLCQRLSLRQRAARNMNTLADAAFATAAAASEAVAAASAAVAA